MENNESNSAVTVEQGTDVSHAQVPVMTSEVITKTNPKIFQRMRFTVPKKYFVGAVLLMVILVAGVLVYIKKDEHVAIKQFTNVYSFVSEKISKSAPIQINLPEGVDESTARDSITFSPEIAGSWKTEELEKIVIFEPKEPLRSGVYYAVNMDTGSLQMSGDFYVDEDPKIEAIFPGDGTESHEDSEITIVFNRPMVPLTTLSVQEKVELPIVITPETPGKFKWISTRNLQFIPETTLIPSSDYTIEVREGFYSLDGLPVAPVKQTFVTRPLRYEYVSNEQIGYRSPIIIDFNQAVDIDETKKQISVKRQGSDEVSIEIEYGDITYYDRESRKYVTEPDPSKLFVYQKKDSHGRSKFWDFETTYEVSIRGAVPLSGTKDLVETRSTTVRVPNIVETTNAESERSTLVRSDLLDPQGKLIVTFYDDVDKDASDIDAKGLVGIEYGERCKTDEHGESVQRGSNCEKETDTKKLIFTFNASLFSTNESFDLELKKIESKDGFRINADPIKIPLKTYPSFQILKTIPQNQSGDAPLDGMYVCSNVPLKQPPEEEGLSSYVKTNGYIVFGRWSFSRYISEPNTYTQCEQGEFETKLQYGLLPLTDYSLSLTLTDEFGQITNEQLLFKTGPAKENYTRFHNMQKQYNVTTPDRTKLTYAVENLEYVDMHICRMEPETFLERTAVDRVNEYTPPQDGGCTQVFSEKISLPAKYWVNNYFQINLADYFPDTRGHYIITFSNPLYTDAYGSDAYSRQLYDRTYVSVTNLAVGKKEVEYSDNAWSESSNPANNQVLDSIIKESSNLYWVNDSKSLTASQGASVTQYEGGYNKSFVRKTTSFTDDKGIARIEVLNDLVGAVIRSGADTAVITDWADTLMYANTTSNASKTYVYTDRPIYRPGHTVHIRGIDRIGFDGTYEIWNTEQVKLVVYDSKGSSVYETALSQNEYGTFNTEFELHTDAPLGTYRIEAYGQSFSFDVEEYVPAAFKLEAESDKEEYTNGDTMKISVQADYYFGVPLTEGSVSYSVTAQDYYFDRYTDEYFNFGRSWYYCYSCGYGDDFLFRGETSVDENGRAVIESSINLKDYYDDLESEGSKLVTVSITAKDINGRSVSMQKSFIVHKGDFYIGSKTDQYYTGVNTPLTLRVKTVDTKGKPIDLSNIERTVHKVTWETFKRQEVDGGFYYRSVKKLDQISSEKIKTDSNGNWNGTLTFVEEGEYEVHVSKVDERGNKIKTISNVYIYGNRSVSVPPNNNYELDIEVETSDVEVGDTASLLIKSPYEKAKVLIAVERGTVYDYWIADVTGGLYLHTFPVKSEYAPNMYVSALLLSSGPEIKYGNVRYKIGTKEHELSVDVTSDKAYYLPGETVTLHVETLDNLGRSVPAEVSLAVADLSVLALKGNPKKNPLLFFYDGFPLSVTTASNIKNILYEVGIPLGTKGGGGASPDDLAKKKRGLFKDTAFWQASVVTDQNGKATISFTLPDNLTTWQIEALGVTKDTKLGVDYSEFTTKKDLMAVPLKPRFVVPGDAFSLGAKVFNQTDKARTINVTLKSDTLIFTGTQEDSIFIDAGESKTVYFSVQAPNDKKGGEHTFTFTASDESFIDSVEQVIPITPNTTFETVATANFTKTDVAVEYLYVPNEVVSGEGGLTINANATMAVFMTDALAYMVTYPYGCSEQLASSLSTIGTLKEALTLPNVKGSFDTLEFNGVTYTVDEVVKNGLAQIYETQMLNGGFAYYKGLNPNLFLSMHVLSALVNLKDAGYEVRADVIQRVVAYIESETKNVYTTYPATNQETVILAEYVIRMANGGKETSLTKIVESLIDDEAFLNEKISSMTLAYLAILTADNFGWGVKGDVYTALKNRIDIDGRGAYLSGIESANMSFYETPIKDTALLLKAFAAHEDEHPAMGNVLRWLLAGRDQNGVWGGTQNTFAVIDGMIDYLKWQHETESHFTIRGLLDGVEIFGHEFNADNIFGTFTHFIPLDTLAREKLLPLVFERTNKNDMQNNFYYDMSLKYFLPVESLPPRDEGITITRELYILEDTKEEDPVTTVPAGDIVRGKIVVTIPDAYAHVTVEDMIPAGFEIVNFNLETEDTSLLDTDDTHNPYEDSYIQADSKSLFSRLGNFFGASQTAQVFRSKGFGGSYKDGTRKLYPTHTESHDDRVFLYIEELSEGVYEYEYFLRALVPGEFQQLPARAEEMFFPEVFGRTGGNIITVVPAK